MDSLRNRSRRISSCHHHLYRPAGPRNLPTSLCPICKSFSDGLALVVPDNMLRLTGGCAKAGYLNKKGKWAIAPAFDRGEDFSEGMAAVSLHGNCGVGGKWGYVDKDGAVVIPFRFTWASPFREGRACVKLDTVREAVIDRFGNVLNGVKCK